MIHLNVHTTSLSAERLWDVERSLGQLVNINASLNVLEIDHRSDGSLEAPFVFTVSFNPPIAQLSIRGKVRITGDSEDTEKIMDDQKANKPPPIQLVQAISTSTMADSIILCRSINVPPPIPPIPQPETQPSAKRQPDSRYT